MAELPSDPALNAANCAKLWAIFTLPGGGHGGLFPGGFVKSTIDGGWLVAWDR